MTRLWGACVLLAVGCGATDSANPFESTGGQVSDGATSGQGAVGEGGRSGAGAGNLPTGGVRTGGAGAGGAPAGTGATPSGGSSGVTATGGAGGVSAAGTGGIVTGGAAGGDAVPDAGPDEVDAGTGTGGDASVDGSTPADAGPPRTMRCGGSLTCDLEQGQVCCASFSSPTHQCLSSGASTTGCNAERHCDSQDDCSASQVCCAEWVTGGFSDRYSDFTCVDSCEGSDAVVECRSRDDCPAGTFCCGDLTDNSTRYADLRCEPSCADETICDTVDDCPDPGEQECVQDDILPTGFGRCVSD